MLAFYRLKTDLYSDICRLECWIAVVSCFWVHLAFVQQVAECEKVECVDVETALCDACITQCSEVCKVVAHFYVLESDVVVLADPE